MLDFDQLQETLPPLYALTTPDSTTPHTVIVLPSFSIGETMMSHYASRLGSLEHRFLVAVVLLRMPSVRILYVCSQKPDESVVDLYFSLLPPELADGARDRFNIVAIEDMSARSVAAKLVEQPATIEAMRNWIGDTPAYIEPWNVTEVEVQLATGLQVPVNGTAPELWPLGFKSAGRELMRDADVPVPPGFENLHTVDDAVTAIDRLRTADPDLRSVVLKHDNSGAGDGNAVIGFDGLAEPGSAMSLGQLRSRVNSLDPDYIADLDAGFIVESMIAGTMYSSPSVQLDIQPDRSVRVLSSHEQILDDSGQIYLGCRFPANPAYAAEIGHHAVAVGHALADRGALGRLAVDFVTSADDESGPWSVHALEINLRRGGTSHPLAVLRHLAPGQYDVDAGGYVDDRGQEQHYVATDNLVDEHWTGLPPAAVIDALASAGILFDTATRTGVVPHMLSCLAIDGRFGVTAVGNTPEQANTIYNAIRGVVDELAAGRPR